MKPILTLLLLMSIGYLNAQEEKRNITSLDYMEYLYSTDINIKDVRSKIEKFYKKEGKYELYEPKTIPIVFHVLYSNETQKVSEANIIDQLKAVNDHFSLKYVIEDSPNDPEGEYRSRAVDTKIAFCFPDVKENGSKSAINYVPTEIEVFEDFISMKSKQSGGAKPWNTNKYLNVWVCDLDKNSGFAQLPGGPSGLDGIVIDYKYILGENSEYLGGTTLTHLIGNYLNLFPLWGEERCHDDMIEDTPIHNDPNIECPTSEHITLCGENLLEMTMNFMDNTNDDCQYMFTLGQKERMHLTLSPKGPRKQLVITDTECDQEIIEEPLVARSIRDILEGMIDVFPNPVSNLLHVSIEEELITPHASINIFEATGKLISHLSYNMLVEGTVIIDVSKYNQGLYLLKFSNGKETISKKVIIE